jgi:large subunit ribosomal protein L39
LKDIKRTEKIEVKVVVEAKKEYNLIMNKSLSTPFNCAMHISELYTNRSVVAKIDEKTPWDMYRPLKDSCKLEFLHFKQEDPSIVNQVGQKFSIFFTFLSFLF